MVAIVAPSQMMLFCVAIGLSPKAAKQESGHSQSVSQPLPKS